nr:MAG TPA: hypothetical protein [Bacteriophage sp.]
MQEITDTYYLGSRRMVSILPTTISFVYSLQKGTRHGSRISNASVRTCACIHS